MKKTTVEDTQVDGFVDKTSMLYWFPKIEGLVPVPQTTHIHMDEEAERHIWSFFDGEPDKKTGAAFEFIASLQTASAEFTKPYFLRTAYTSAKHHWKDTCLLISTDVKTITNHVLSIAEFSEIADFIGLGFRDWFIREMLPTEPAFHAFRGDMPITCEFRVFAENGELICCHPYWPHEALEGHVDESRFPDWRERLSDLQLVDAEPAINLALETSLIVSDEQWSIDVLKTKRGWFVTDMALLSQSWHWPRCENAK